MFYIYIYRSRYSLHIRCHIYIFIYKYFYVRIYCRIYCFLEACSILLEFNDAINFLQCNKLQRLLTSHKIRNHFQVSGNTRISTFYFSYFCFRNKKKRTRTIYVFIRCKLLLQQLEIVIAYMYIYHKNR